MTWFLLAEYSSTRNKYVLINRYFVTIEMVIAGNFALEFLILKDGYKRTLVICLISPALSLTQEGVLSEAQWELVVVVPLLNCDQLFMTPWTLAHQSPLSMRFPRQEHWSGLPFPSPGDLPNPGIKHMSPALARKPSGRAGGPSVQFSSVAQSCSTLWPHGLQQARLPCPSPTPGACSNSCLLCWWCHPTISSSVILFSSHLQSFQASGSFQMSQFFASGGQSIGVSASASVLPMNIQDWFPLGWTGLISFQSKGLSRIFSNTTVQKHQFFGAQLAL